MRPKLILTLLAMLSALPALLTAQTHARFMGRVQPTNEGTVMAFPGIAVDTSFTGSGRIAFRASLASAGPCYFNVYVNGVELPMIEVDSDVPRDYVISDRLDPQKTYDVRVVRRNEAWQGTVLFQEFVAEESVEWLEPTPLPSRKLMCLGDSITCGDRNVFMGPYAKEGNHNSNAEVTYGWDLAKMFNSQVNLVSYGGKGLIRDWEGKEEPITLGEFFERSLPDDPSTSWDHQAYVPDAITICIGQNDFNQGVIEADRYVPAYIKLVDRLTGLYPDAKILLISSPMQNPESASDGHKKDVLEGHLQAVVEHYREQGNDNVRFHSVSYYPGGEYNAHPIAPQHYQMARELYEDLGPWLGWLQER